MDLAAFSAAALADPLPGRNPNQAARGLGNWKDQSDPRFDLLFCEFDDQGRPFEANAIDRIMQHVVAVAATADPFLIVFVHGWKHSARDDDPNVVAVRRLLHANAHTEELRHGEGRPRRVIGIYVGWRGLSLHWAGVLEYLTFWGRKEAALRVALGSVRELFARLRQFRLRSGTDRSSSGARLVLVGHSFGGLVVYSALSEYLIESVAVPADDLDPVLPFGDLTILVNPAFEASKYYPLHAIVARRSFAPRQAPVFVSVTADNDWATGLAFPLGRLLSPWTGPSLDAREHEANFDTMGHVLWMQTHDLNLDTPAPPSGAAGDPSRRLTDQQRADKLVDEDSDYQTFVRDSTDAEGRLLPGWSRRYSSGAMLRQIQPPPGAGEAGMSPDNPFWVIRAASTVVNGHNGIFEPVFLDFLRQMLDDTFRADDPAGKR